MTFQGLIRVEHMSRSRYVNCQQFLAIISRLCRRESYVIQATALFDMLSERSTVDTRIKMLDLRAFLLLIETADGDDLRKFENKASRAATSIEFWVRKHHTAKI